MNEAADEVAAANALGGRSFLSSWVTTSGKEDLSVANIAPVRKS
jgi:hypothetical protein